MGDFLEANLLRIGMLGAFVVAGLLYHQHPDKLGDAAGTLAALVAVVAVYYQGYLTNLTHSIDVVRSYDDRFEDSIARQRKVDPTLFEDFVWLHDRVTRIEKRKRRCTHADIAPTSAGEFLTEEKDA